MLAVEAKQANQINLYHNCVLRDATYCTLNTIWLLSLAYNSHGNIEREGECGKWVQAGQYSCTTKMLPVMSSKYIKKDLKSHLTLTLNICKYSCSV